MKRLVIVLIAALTLSGCSNSPHLDAASLAERVIIGIGDDITPPYPTPRPAEYLAAWAIESPRLPSDREAEYTVEALAWEGHSGDETGAKIDIRVTVHAPAQSGGWSELSLPEDDATRCWRLTVFGFHDYDSLESEEIECPTGPAPAPPAPLPLPSFPDDLDALLTTALADPDPEAAVRAAFPDEFYSIEAATENGETAIALGIPEEHDCAVGIIHADGSTEVVRGFDWEVLQPGEMGCVPDLYFHPVLTH